MQILKTLKEYSKLNNYISNKLTRLYVSNNISLEWLKCSDNPLTSLDVSKNTTLTYLSCFENKLTSLDVSKNTALKYLNCDGNIFDCDALRAKYSLKQL